MGKKLLKLNIVYVELDQNIMVKTEICLLHSIINMFLEPGLDLLIQLTRLTGVFFSSPTGIIGQYNHSKYFMK